MPFVGTGLRAGSNLQIGRGAIDRRPRRQPSDQRLLHPVRQIAVAEARAFEEFALLRRK
jgi:hypothetical protein